MAKTVAESLVSTLREGGVRRAIFAGELDNVTDIVRSKWRMLP